MDKDVNIRVIARIHSDFTTKFGIPRQSGLAPSQISTIIFEKEFRDENVLRGLEDYSHIWLIWGFSMVPTGKWSPTVKPPRLGGNKRMGVFATRSPFRPNPIGLSSVKLIKIEKSAKYGFILHVGGADLADNTPIYDIKPYLSFTDSHPNAINGFADSGLSYGLKVVFDQKLLSMIPEYKRAALIEALEQDPRPAYQDDPNTPYGFEYAGFDIRFKVDGNILTVFNVIYL
ncbi:MAG: tRNA (N6-threonylcarbamoyladenosine(37)-N6)-methyltransferase TrmO [Clostridia bacterium]|nr:tRNA (N6-threonylcarbamoyladenosine(37)-N6)-methyltransferase TrmO [Clostridia bacterium]